MARPRIIRIDDKRTITMKGFTAEEQKKVENLFLPFYSTPDEFLSLSHPKVDKPMKLEPEEAKQLVEGIKADTVAAAAPPSSLKNVAISTYQEGKVWHFVTVKYDPRSKAARVDTDRSCGESKLHAVEEFKKAAVTNNIV